MCFEFRVKRGESVSSTTNERNPFCGRVMLPSYILVKKGNTGLLSVLHSGFND